MKLRWIIAISFIVITFSFFLRLAQDSKNISKGLSQTSADVPPFNVVLVLTDDQNFNTLWAMPIIQEKLVARGVTFSKALITTPVCCPSRASILSGGFYPHNTGVLTNKLPNGGVKKFQDTDTLPTLLQGAGYHTGFFGKYMNGYGSLAPYIPPGWTKFVGTWGSKEAAVGSSDSQPGQGELLPITTHRIEFETAEALAFLDEQEQGDIPFFCELSVYPPHFPANPLPEDSELFQDYVYRGRAYGEKDISDKPPVVVEKMSDFDTHYFNSVEEQDEFHRDQLRSLQGVDRAVGAIFDKIEAQGKLNNTVFIFTSDNGYLWGEHKLWGKGVAYEESILVPFVVVMPGIAPRTDNHLVAANLDIGPTVFELAGVTKETDGLSLVPLLQDPTVPWREEVLIQNFMEDNKIGMWAGLRIISDSQGEWKYIEHSEGYKELYDLINDPYELENKHDDPAYQGIVNEFAERLENLRGLAIATVDIDNTHIVGQESNIQHTAWGGTPPYTWSVFQGQLPQGLLLDNDSGTVNGIPLQAGTSELQIEVKDSSIAWHTGLPQSYITDYTLTIDPDVVNVKRVIWRSSDELLVVRATSSAGDSVSLEVDGFGLMSYNANRGLFRGAYTVKQDNVPETVTVTSSGGGSLTVPVVLK